MYYVFYQVYFCLKIFCILVVDMLKSFDDKFGDCFEKIEQMKIDEEMEIVEKGVMWFDFWILKGKLKFKMFFNFKLKVIEI